MTYANFLTRKSVLKMLKFSCLNHKKDNHELYQIGHPTNIDLFLDIRQRRGVRGSQYKYVNSSYLQAKLHEMGIEYKYIKDLAPTKEIRQKQKDADKQNGETKKQRTTLGPIFASEYKKQILDNYDVKNLAEQLVDAGVKNVVLFCVEEHADACHRSLVASKLAEILSANVINL